ncbi:MAG TPA: DUF1697 domain-containing protein [Candidatus Saccharimonadales bacterium]|nr:DUF1697 domain-containing protein [Candidatus Saccharimonadales bacterium]
MTRYVALLRGINVGGKTKVEMPRLKKIFETVGCRNVITYINSGNVMFDDHRPAEELARLLENAIKKQFELAVPVVVRDQANIEMLVNKIPADWNNAEQRTEVMFLWDEVDRPDSAKQVKIDPKVEKLIYLPGALVWNIDRAHYKQGSGAKIIKSEFYKKMTGRNINTVRKLSELLKNT